MKKFFPISLFVACLFVATALLSSCEFDASEEPDHPYFASYAMSANYTEYNGPDQLLLDFQNWVKENQVYYDKQSPTRQVAHQSMPKPMPRRSRDLMKILFLR